MSPSDAYFFIDGVLLDSDFFFKNLFVMALAFYKDCASVPVLTDLKVFDC